MNAADENQAPAPRELRNFGLLLGALFVAFFIVLPALLRRHYYIWPCAVAVALWLMALGAPKLLRPVHAGWSRLGALLGWANTRAVLTLLFVISIAPAGILMRLLGRDRMARRFEPARPSYRITSRPRSAKSMERPF